jgi:uncharacterized protein (DUF58 family)
LNAPENLSAARTLADQLPNLLLAAERLAFAAAPGLHGRRRGGAGDSFWQFRDWQSGEDAKRIDWRRSARSDRFFYKEREREVPASIALSLEDTPSLDFQSSPDVPTKRGRATILLLALAAILLRAGERVAIAGATPPIAGIHALQTLASALVTRGSAGFLSGGSAGFLSGGSTALDPRARRIRFGDFLAPNPAFNAPPGGAIVQILDPAECDFPFLGRIIFEGSTNEAPVEASAAEQWREVYKSRLAAHRHVVAQTATLAGQTFLFHRTDNPPTQALYALYQPLRAS